MGDSILPLGINTSVFTVVFDAVWIQLKGVSKTEKKKKKKKKKTSNREK